MRMESIETLFVEELKEAYDFERQILDSIGKMTGAVSSDKLRQALEQHQRVTEKQAERLEQVFERRGMSPERKTCEGMQGILSEGEHVLEQGGAPYVLDTALIGAAKRVEHYEMAAYDSLCLLAEGLGWTREARLLRKTFDEEVRMDEQLRRNAEREVEEAVSVMEEGAGNGGDGGSRSRRRQSAGTARGRQGRQASQKRGRADEGAQKRGASQGRARSGSSQTRRGGTAARQGQGRTTGDGRSTRSASQGQRSGGAGAGRSTGRGGRQSSASSRGQKRGNGRGDGATREELLRRAQQLGIEGRSRMSKKELEREVSRRV